MVVPSVSLRTTGPLFAFVSPLVEIELELNSTCGDGLVEGEGTALGDGDGSSEGLGLAAGEECEGTRGPGGSMTLELDEDLVALSAVGWRVIAK